MRSPSAPLIVSSTGAPPFASISSTNSSTEFTSAPPMPTIASPARRSAARAGHTAPCSDATSDTPTTSTPRVRSATPMLWPPGITMRASLTLTVTRLTGTPHMLSVT